MNVNSNNNVNSIFKLHKLRTSNPPRAIKGQPNMNPARDKPKALCYAFKENIDNLKSKLMAPFQKPNFELKLILSLTEMIEQLKVVVFYCMFRKISHQNWLNVGSYTEINQPLKKSGFFVVHTYTLMTINFQ